MKRTLAELAVQMAISKYDPPEPTDDDYILNFLEIWRRTHQGQSGWVVHYLGNNLFRILTSDVPYMAFTATACIYEYDTWDLEDNWFEYHDSIFTDQTFVLYNDNWVQIGNPGFKGI